MKLGCLRTSIISWSFGLRLPWTAKVNLIIRELVWEEFRIVVDIVYDDLLVGVDPFLRLVHFWLKVFQECFVNSNLFKEFEIFLLESIKIITFDAKLLHLLGCLLFRHGFHTRHTCLATTGLGSEEIGSIGGGWGWALGILRNLGAA